MEEWNSYDEAKEESLSREDLVTAGYDEIDPIFPNNPIRSDQIECEIRNAWRDASGDTAAAPEVIFLENLSERLYKLSNAREEYTCPAVEIALPDRIVELVEKVSQDAFRESDTGDPGEVMEIMASLAQSLAAKLYNAKRKVELSFSRSDWRLIDRMIDRENRSRSKANQVAGLRELLYEYLAKLALERSGTGFFSTPDPEMLELAEGLSNIAMTSKKRGYE